MSTNNEKPTQMRYKSRKGVSWERGKERAEKVMIKYFKKMRVDQKEAKAYMQKILVSSNERNTKAFYECLIFEFSFLFLHLMTNSQSIAFVPEIWITDILEIWYSQKEEIIT